MIFLVENAVIAAPLVILVFISWLVVNGKGGTS